MGGPADFTWAAIEADRRAQNEECRTRFWEYIGRKYDKPDHDKRLLKNLSHQDEFGWTAPAGEIGSNEIWEKLIGREIARNAWIDGQTRQRLLREQSDTIAARLENQGITARYEGRSTTIVGLCTELSDRANSYRNTNIIPVQQSKNVHDMFKHVQYFLDHTPSNKLRMLVVSGGWCPLLEYREHHTAHTRRMSRFAAEPLLKEFGISIEYYNVEDTIKRTDDGIPMLNMHSHALLRCNRYLGKEKWSHFLDFARRFFPKGYVHDGRIENPEECVKYVFKPSEFDSLSDEELAELFHQLHGRPAEATGKARNEGALKFFHPLGEIRALRRALKAQGRKLLRVPTMDDRWEWRYTDRKRSSEAREQTPTARDENVVLAITTPIPKFSPHFEPCFVVKNYDGDFDELVRQNQVQEFVDKARTMWRARREAQMAAECGSGAAGPLLSSMKHTTTTTVRDDPWNVDIAPATARRCLSELMPDLTSDISSTPRCTNRPPNLPKVSPISWHKDRCQF